MTCIYEIRYAIQWNSSEPTHWEPQNVRVAAGADALEAVEKVRVRALAHSRLEDNGREDRCTGFRLHEVLLVAQAEF